MKILRTGVIALCAAAAAACATEPQTGAGPRSPSQVKQQELTQMEAQGQRNDIDKPFKQ